MGEYNNDNQKKLNQERIEMIKIKQGLVDASEIAKAESEKKPEIPMTFKKKVENFFYHYKSTVIVVAFVVILGGYFTFDYITTVRPDGGAIYLTQTMGVSSNYDKIENIMNKYGKDYNGDNKISYQIFYIPIDNTKTLNPQVVQANITKMVAEISRPDSMLIFADEAQDSDLKFANTLADLRSEYPDNENVKEFGFYLKDTKFKDLIGADKISDGLFVGIRKVKENEKYTEKMKEKYDIARNVLDGLIKELSY